MTMVYALCVEGSAQYAKNVAPADNPAGLEVIVNNRDARHSILRKELESVFESGVNR